MFKIALFRSFYKGQNNHYLQIIPNYVKHSRESNKVLILLLIISNIYLIFTIWSSKTFVNNYLDP